MLPRPTTGFGRATSTPIAQLLISSAGWRLSYMLLATFMALLVVPLMRTWAHYPMAIGQRQGRTQTQRW
jgi:hypothetical protein